MNSIKPALRKLFRKGEHTLTRIITLSTGLAFGIVLLSEVFFYFSYDSFYPDANRVYIVNENYNADKQSQELKAHPRVSGAIGPGLQDEVPGIEAATRLNSIGSQDFFSEQNRVYKGHVVLADDKLFEVLPRPIVRGLGRESLKSPMMCIISDEIAGNMGGDVIGRTIELKNYPGKRITIGAVFEALPVNTNFSYDVAISMVSTSAFTWDGTGNWLGNDRYYTCVKLEEGVAPANLAHAVRLMQEKHQDIEKYEAQGVVLKYSFEPLRNAYANEAMDMIALLSAITFIVLLVSILNYLLLTMSTLVNRAKTSAIYKCYGAEKRNLQGLIFTESSIIFLISIVAAIGLILVLKPYAEAQVGHSLDILLNRRIFLPIMSVMVIMMIPIGYIPGRLFAMTPVAVAFRTYHQKKRGWKKGLLSVQFAGVSLFVAMLVVVNMQFNTIRITDHGYNVENVYFGSVSGMDPHRIETLLHELKSLPEVENAGLGFELPVGSWPSGNNVISPDGERELFNVADFYYVDDAYFSILGIPVVEGTPFSEEHSIADDILISRKFADMLVLNNGWDDGIPGHSVQITEHHNKGQSSRISGIFPDLIIGTISNSDIRPSVFFYLPREAFVRSLEENPGYPFLVLIKTVPGSHENITLKMTDIFNSAMLRGEARVESLALVQSNAYHPVEAFRNSIYAGVIIVLIITLMGLLGYLNEEIIRQRKSLAIRKINGATTLEIVKLFVLGLAGLAIPFIIAGLVGAWFLATKWMEGFLVQISLKWWIFALTGAAILVMTSMAALVNSIRAANTNPVEALRYE